MSQSLKFAKMKVFDDFIRFVGIVGIPFIHYISMNGKHIYFVQITSFGGNIIYFVDINKKIKEKYIVFNRFKDEFSLSDKFSSDGQSNLIAIIDLEKTDIFKDYKE